MWERIKKAFCESETIFVARAGVLIGTTLEVVSQAQPDMFSSLIGARWFPMFLIGHGVLVEYVRRRRDDDLKKRGE
jgi:hypothetical protein